MPCSECPKEAVAEAFDLVEKRWFDLCQKCIDRERPDKVRYFREE